MSKYLSPKLETVTPYTPGEQPHGSNFYNKKVMGISKTCGACVQMITESGWHLCEARNE